ncbi:MULTISPECIES: putative monovalent cation/H+ antiporter subunit A [unclassified Vibrio]|uniref:putative monovalent cation/H+ antiporter subunit A n=1 Tax=unclassified Vibrio TaxID=2614977 RepID=UPI0014826D3A|nr:MULTISPECIES: putative monovalent cation/H+ antiporter subunit A [unclassified Vibrio]NNN45112.1 putative monovalent cation/H+ antiporter subunit A [Vibrio sp. 1-1(7)]NNN72485.1 putative monovalent cation/H+ antiporter subunit A [Vibrio sp. 12-2(3-a)]
MLLALMSGFVATFLVPLLYRRLGEQAVWWIALLPAALFIYFFGFINAIAQGDVLFFHYHWIPSLDISLDLRLDGLSLLFALLVSGIGTLVIVYTGSYLAGHADQRKLVMYLCAFMGSMLGVVLTNNLMAMFVFWELTSITSYMLIGFYHEEDKSRKSALQGLFITVGGGLALMAGILLLGQIAGSYQLDQIISQGPQIQQHALFFPMILLILAGAFTKSAQVPFHFWLPNAMAAPTPVSSFLHSATMVKAGIYLMARLQPVMAGESTWTILLVTVGALTMLVGSIMAVTSTDLKRILAYTTVASLGTLTLLIGIGNETALIAAMVFLLAHALYKGALFMAAGTVDHETGTKDIRQLGGLRRTMPQTAIFMSLAALALAGIPPVLGFIAKESMLMGLLTSPWQSMLLLVGVISSICLVACAGLVVIKPFWGAKIATPKSPHEAPLAMRLGFSLLATLGLMFGVLPSLVSPLITASASAVIGRPIEPVSLSLWHGFNLPLLMSFLAFVFGYLLFKYWDKLSAHIVWAKSLLNYGPEKGYEYFMVGLVSFAKWLTTKLQNGYLSNYILTIFITTIVLVSYTMGNKVGWYGTLDFSGVEVYEILISAIIITVVGYACITEQRLGAVAAIGALGFSMALIYVFFSAPDLAITQVLIETLTVILLVFVLFKLPRFQRLSSSDVRWRDALVAIVFGGMMTLLVMTVIHFAEPERISDYLIEHSYVIAKGRNIVNVILVDYRALDTLGEIFVLALAAIGVTAMIKLDKGKS